jgi:hypothetical protein
MAKLHRRNQEMNTTDAVAVGTIVDSATRQNRRVALGVAWRTTLWIALLGLVLGALFGILVMITDLRWAWIGAAYGAMFGGGAGLIEGVIAGPIMGVQTARTLREGAFDAHNYRVRARWITIGVAIAVALLGPLVIAVIVGGLNNVGSFYQSPVWLWAPLAINIAACWWASSKLTRYVARQVSKVQEGDLVYQIEQPSQA